MSTQKFCMTFDDYQKKSRATAQFPREGLSPLYYLTLGLVGEAGEIANKVKKIIRDDGGIASEEKRKMIQNEMGDVLWYMAQLATELDFSFDEVAVANLEKLLSRQRRGVIHGDGDVR